MMKNYPGDIELLPYQQALWDKLSEGGFKQGQISLYTAGRQTGKSIYNNNLCKEIMMQSLHGMKVPQWVKDADKYKFSRKWHVVEYDWKDYDAIREWCTEQFGPEPKYPDAWCRWQSRHEGVAFRDEGDAALFILRWI